MTIIEEINEALSLLGTEDLDAAEMYLAWMRFRRLMNKHFYFQAHWVTQPNPQLPARQAHWI